MGSESEAYELDLGVVAFGIPVFAFEFELARDAYGLILAIETSDDHGFAVGKEGVGEPVRGGIS